jgi:hypothetical protein
MSRHVLLSMATIAKRHPHAFSVSYLMPLPENAGLYKGLKMPRCSGSSPCFSWGWAFPGSSAARWPSQGL